MNLFDINQQDQELIDRAFDVVNQNFDNVKFNHTVGAAVRCRDGGVFLGVNCDGNHGACAEYIAIGAAITAGRRDFDTIVAIYGGDGRILPPCGNCRQMLWEYSPEIMVILNTANGIKKAKISDLLPFAEI